jgi:hypothetical protein
MSLLTASMAIVFFFGFAEAGISAPSCSSTWKWVCILSSPQCVLWPLLDLMDFSSSHSILLAKIHVRLHRTCFQHVMGVVSRFLVILSCIDEPYRLISFSAYTLGPLPQGYHYAGPRKGFDDRNLCECSTVGYSLISACGGCQGRIWETYDPHRFPHLNSRNLCICP